MLFRKTGPPLTAANALGIGQYLEHQFGRKNVFIDVDMRAGTKFPDVLQQRLAECKVLLALIGSGWLSAHDEHGRRRLDRSDDWVRLEISHALKRGITVIPVRVNGAALPTREELPDEIRGLLDHQAVSVTTTGFRNEMAGLARDIRAIPSARAWRLLAAAIMGLLIVSAASALVYSFGKLQHVQNPQIPPGEKQNVIWNSEPDQWVMFSFDNSWAAHYFKPASTKFIGDKVAYIERFPLILTKGTVPNDKIATSEDQEVVMGCKVSKWLQTDVTFYNNAGAVVSHFKRADPSAVDVSSIGQQIDPNSIVANAQHLLCSSLMRTPLLTKRQLSDNALPYLSPNWTGDGDLFNGPVEPTSVRRLPSAMAR